MSVCGGPVTRDFSAVSRALPGFVRVTDPSLDDQADSRPVRQLLSAETIAARVKEIGSDLSSIDTQQGLTVLGVMTGGLIFLADLVREIRRPLTLAVVHARSYQGTTPGPLKTSLEAMPDVAGRDVVLVDDIFDTGRTLTRLRDEVLARDAARVRTAVMLRKTVQRDADYQPDWVGFEIADEFVVGYGLDLDGQFRHLPFIGVLD